MDSNKQVYKKGDMRVIHEYFSSIHQMLQCLSSRDNNEVMRNEHSSHKSGDYEWYKTHSYSEAVELITKGYKDILGDLRLGLQKASKFMSDIEVNRSQIISDVQGAVPVVPNYLQGLPKAMAYRQPTPRKIKTINIIYAPCENCGANPKEFINAGIAVLSAIRAIEKNNISVKLDCMFSDAVASGEACIGIVRLKNYSDRLDLQKICFPIAHPSMLRRIGFKYLETAPDMRESRFNFGYGSTPSLEKLEGFLKLPERTVLLNMRLINKELKDDPVKVLEYINNKILDGKSK